MVQKIKITQTSNADMNIGVPKTCHFSSNNSDTKKITMAQQTAVDWLIHNIVKDKSIKPISINDWIPLFHQAKQMEKIQIMNAWLNGDNDNMYEPKQLQKQAEQYYNETYVK